MSLPLLNGIEGRSFSSSPIEELSRATIVQMHYVLKLKLNKVYSHTSRAGVRVDAVPDHK
jgi:hypothetical protein